MKRLNENPKCAACGQTVKDGQKVIIRKGVVYCEPCAPAAEEVYHCACCAEH